MDGHACPSPCPRFWDLSMFEFVSESEVKICHVSESVFESEVHKNRASESEVDI